MAQWKITPTEERVTTEYLYFTKDGMSIIAEHLCNGIEVIVESDTRPDITVPPDGFDWATLIGTPGLTFVSANLIDPYDYRYNFDITDETQYEYWRNFLRDEHGATTLEKTNLLEAEGWLKLHPVISKCGINVEEIV